MKKNLIIMIVLTAFVKLSSAQDIIFKKDHQEIKAKVTEIGLDEIKYKLWEVPEGPDIVIAKTDIWKIKFSNGQEMMITQDPYDVSQDQEVRKKTHSIKFEFFSPLTDDIALGYEQMIKVGMNFEGKIGIIGYGTNPDAVDASGAFVKAGIKFLKHSDYVMRGMKYAHGLRGAYIKPELIFSHYVVRDVQTGYYVQNNNQYPFYGSTYKVEKQDVSVTHVAAEIVFGKQVILGQTVTLDWYGGVGYGFMSDNYHNPNAYNYYGDDESQFYYGYGHLFTGKKTPLSLSTGMTLGVLF